MVNGQVFYDGLGTDVDFGPFTPAGQMIVGTWYKSKNQTVTFNEDGTTDYIADATYKFLPYQGEVLVYDASKKLRQIIRVHDVSAEELVVSTLGSTSFSVWSVAQPGINGHEYVEIGGLKWATMNVGATTVAGSYATCYGDYYAWGETTPRYMTITRSGTNSASFTWRNDYSSGYSNYPTYTGTTLDASHDAATANWGSTWRTPTKAEYEALAVACSGSSANGQTPVTLINTITEGGIYWLSSTQTVEPSYTGVAGLLFVSKSDISKRVFFPASGYVYDTSLYYGGTGGRFWSSSLYTSITNCAYNLNFYSSYVHPSSYSGRYGGFTVRPVSD